MNFMKKLNVWSSSYEESKLCVARFHDLLVLVDERLPGFDV